MGGISNFEVGNRISGHTSFIEEGKSIFSCSTFLQCIEKEVQKQKRIYELSCVDKPAKDMPFQPSFRHLTNFILIHEGDSEKTVEVYKDEVKTPEDKERLVFSKTSP